MSTNQMAAEIAKWLLGLLPSFIRNDWFHLVRAQRSVLAAILLFFALGVLIGRAWAGYLNKDNSLWRLSNYALKQRAIEFSSSLQEFAAHQMSSEMAANETNEIGTASIRWRAQYAKNYRAIAIELREVLQSRVCQDYKSPTDQSSLDFEYNLRDGAYEVGANLEGMADELFWYYSIAPRIEALILP